eukprot:RCo001925
MPSPVERFSRLPSTEGRVGPEASCGRQSSTAAGGDRLRGWGSFPSPCSVSSRLGFGGFLPRPFLPPRPSAEPPAGGDAVAGGVSRTETSAAAGEVPAFVSLILGWTPWSSSPPPPPMPLLEEGFLGDAPQRPLRLSPARPRIISQGLSLGARRAAAAVVGVPPSQEFKPEHSASRSRRFMDCSASSRIISTASVSFSGSPTAEPSMLTAAGSSPATLLAVVPGKASAEEVAVREEAPGFPGGAAVFLRRDLPAVEAGVSALVEGRSPERPEGCCARAFLYFSVISASLSERHTASSFFSASTRFSWLT